jgi:hypothetical protein
MREFVAAHSCAKCVAHEWGTRLGHEWGNRSGHEWAPDLVSMWGLGGEGGAGCGFVGVERGVFGDAYHGEDFLEVGGEAEGLDLLAALAGGDHHLNDESDAARVQVLDLREVEDDALDVVGETFVGAEDGGLGGAGDVPGETEDGDGDTGAIELLNSDASDLILHGAISEWVYVESLALSAARNATVWQDLDE